MVFCVAQFLRVSIRPLFRAADALSIVYRCRLAANAPALAECRVIFAAEAVEPRGERGGAWLRRRFGRHDLLLPDALVAFLLV